MKTRSQALAAKKSAASKQTTLPTCVQWEDGANVEQLEVIRHEIGPCRVIAAAGSGKTFALTRRLVRLAETGITPGERILAVTFSKKAAMEMNTRVKQLGVRDARVGTWHSLCLEILKKGQTKWANWEVDGHDDKPQRAKYILKDVLGFKGMNWKGADLARVSSYIGRCKANLWSPESPEAMVAAQGTFAWAAKTAVEAFHRYNDALEEKELLTYDDFMVFVAEHLQSDENIRLEWASKWDQLLCDETQDNNNAQWTLAKLLAWDHQNFMAVGDCFQAIYGFRGSSPDYLANFDKHWPGAKTIWLPRNYRSGSSIIAAANCIVRKAQVPGLEPKDMIGERKSEGKVRILCAEAQDDEANEVVTEISKSVTAGDSTFSDHTVLFRTNAQSRALEESLLKERIPYVVVGGVSFYERKEVRDLLAYLRLAAGRAKVEDVKRSINTPFRFLGAAFVERVMDQVDERTVDDADWPQIVEEVSHQARIQSRQRDSASEWANIIRGMQNDILKAEAPEANEDTLRAATPAQLLEGVIRATRYIDWLNKEEGDETVTDSHAANVREMVRVAERFKTATDLLDYIDETIRAARRQREDKQAGGERVLLMSIHRSKGLEWPHVYVVGLNEMILPHSKGDPEEERRLAYVAATRARDVLTMTFVRRIATRAGVRDVSPSRFLLDTGLPIGSGYDDGEGGAGAGGMPATSETIQESSGTP